MKLLLLAGLAAAVLAKIPRGSWEEEASFGIRGSLEASSFKRGSEYEFHYDGQVATGIPGASSQYSATRLQARVLLAIKGEDKAILTIKDIRMGKVNEEMRNPRAIVPFMAFEEVPLSEEAKTELTLPLMFSYSNGIVSDLVFDGQEKPWSVNIKKAILNMLQVNMNKRGEVKDAEEAQALNETPNSRRSTYETFTTHEKSVEGECETLYTIVSNPTSPASTNVLNVTRTIEFENCKRRPELKYNFRFQDPCESCKEDQFSEDQKFVKSSSVAKFNIAGDRSEFLIESARVESQYQMVPLNREANVITTYVNQTLVLVRSGPFRSAKIAQPRNPVQSDSGLEYTLDWDKEMEEFLMKGEEQARLPVDVKERVQIIKDIVRPLVSEMRDCVSEEAPVHYSKLIKMLRLSPKSALNEIFAAMVHSQPESFSQEEHTKIIALLTDALADAGTKDSVALLAQLIKEGKIEPLRASLTIKQLINLRTPSKEIVEEIKNLLHSQAVQGNWILKQSVQLTLGSIVSGLCMPSEDRLAVLPRPSFDRTPHRHGPNPNLCPMQLQDQLLQHMFEQVQRAEENEDALEDAVLALKTIGNMGLPKSMERLEAIIRSSSGRLSGSKSILRTEAILALRQLRHILPQKVTAILMPIFMAKSEQPEVRIAAAYQLLQTMPARPVLDQMARSLYTERSRQVASFLYSYMSTLSSSTNPCELKLARNLKYALRHGRKIAAAFKPQYSKYVHASAYSRNFRVGAGLSVASVIGSENVVPAFAGLDFHATALGFWSKNLFGLAVVQKNADALLSAALRRTEYSDLSLDSILSRSPRSAASSLKELKNIWEQLNTAARAPRVDGAPVALASLKLKDQEFFMLPISAASLRKLPSVQEIRRSLHQGAHFNVHKAAMLHEMEYKIPTAIGFPLIVNIRIPTVSQISGQVRIASNNGFEIELNNIKPSMASSLLTQVSVWNPVVSSGAKIVATAKVCTPITAKAEVAYKSGKPELRIAVLPQSDNKEIEYVKIETRPMTWTREYRFPLTAYPKAVYKTIMGEQWNRVWNMRDLAAIKKTEELVEKVFGQRVRVSGLWHRSLVPAGPKSLPVCPFSGPNHISLRGEASPEQPKEYVFKMVAEMKSKSSGMKYESFEMEGESWEAEQEQESSTMEAVIKTELSTKGASSPRKAEMETRVSFSPSLRILKAESEMSVEPIERLNARPAKMCARGYIQYPKAGNDFEQLKSKSVVAQMKTTWGYSSCQEENKMEIKVAAKHSQAQKNMMESDPEFAYWQQQNNNEQQMEAYAPIDKQETLAKAQRLFQYNVLAKYSNLHPAIKNATAKLFKAVQHYYWSNTDEIAFDLANPANTIYAQLSIEPRNGAFMNATIKTPVSNVTMTDVALPISLPYLASSIRPIASQIQTPGDVLENIVSPFLPECRLSSQRLRTFDNVAIRAPLSDCWTLLAKDCGSESQGNPAFAVLAKKMSPSSEQKAVKIVTPGKTIQLIPAETAYGSLNVKINGKELNQAEIRRSVENLESVQIVKDDEQQIVKVSIAEAGLRVSADGYSVKVQASPAMKSNLCGICGHYNGEADDDFRTPANENAADARRFIKSHIVKDAECAYPEELADIDASSEELSYEPRWARDYQNEDEEEQYKADSWENEKSKSASSEEWDREESFRPVPRHVVEEAGRKICVSATKIPRCPRESFAEAYEQEPAKVAFRCISRSHPEAHRLLRIVRQQAEIPSEIASVLSEKEPAYSTEYSVPTRCVQY